MKKLLSILILTIAMYGCSGAGDGNPNTDTTTMPVDTNVYNSQSNHVNTSAGTKVADSANKKDTSYRP